MTIAKSKNELAGLWNTVTSGTYLGYTEKAQPMGTLLRKRQLTPAEIGRREVLRRALGAQRPECIELCLRRTARDGLSGSENPSREVARQSRHDKPRRTVEDNGFRCRPFQRA